MSKKTDKRDRNFAIGLYKQHKAGATVRQLAESVGKPESWVSARIKVGERFAEEPR